MSARTARTWQCLSDNDRKPKHFLPDLVGWEWRKFTDVVIEWRSLTGFWLCALLHRTILCLSEHFSPCLLSSPYPVPTCLESLPPTPVLPDWEQPKHRCKANLASILLTRSKFQTMKSKAGPWWQVMSYHHDGECTASQPSPETESSIGKGYLQRSVNFLFWWGSGWPTGQPAKELDNKVMFSSKPRPYQLLPFVLLLVLLLQLLGRFMCLFLSWNMAQQGTL